MSDKFGIWGGAAPGSWCSIKRGDGSWGEWGTRDEADRQQRVFQRETTAAVRLLVYTVVPFDDAREPPATQCRPTSAQLRALQFITKFGSFSVFSANRPTRPTIDVLIDRGWIMIREAAPAVRVTAAGRQVLLDAAKES